MPSEGNPWLHLVRGRVPFPPLSPLVLPPLSPFIQNMANPAMGPATVPDVPSCGRRRVPKRSWGQDVDEPRQVVVEPWRRILKDHPTASKTGKQLAALTGDGIEQEEIQLARDVIETKATSTL
eukprot:5248077-Amphidinium_carterae.1